MALKLNQKNEYRQIDKHKIPIFREFYGSNVAQMPELIKAGRTPVSFAGVIQRRLNLRNGQKDVKDAWMNNYFDTGDAVVYNPEGETLVVLDSQNLRDMTAESPRNGGALLLNSDRDKAFADYEQLKKSPNVVAFKKGKLGKVNEALSREEVKAHAVWKILSRDQALLNDAVDYTFNEYKQRFAKDTPAEDIRIMGFYPGSCNGKAPEMRAFFVSRLEFGSNVLGGSGLDFVDGRLVGLAPEARAKSLVIPEVRIYTIADVQKAKKELDELTQVRPELLNDTRSLLGKL